LAVAALYGALSLVTFATYGIDKHQARRGGRRVPEARLHALALLGGFAGAWLGRRTFRHKTQKGVFTLWIGVALALHLGGWAAWWWRAAR